MSVSPAEVRDASRAFCQAVDDLGRFAVWNSLVPQPVNDPHILVEGGDD